MEPETYDITEAACCIWEALLAIRSRVTFEEERGETSEYFLKEINEGFIDHGTAQMRYLAITHAEKCHLDYVKAVEDGFDDAFDWDFVPTWVRENFTIS